MTMIRKIVAISSCHFAETDDTKFDLLAGTEQSGIKVLLMYVINKRLASDQRFISSEIR